MLPLFGFLPFGIIGVAFILTGVAMLFLKMTIEDMTEILIAMGTIWIIVIMVLILISQFCFSIHPIEQFDAGPTPATIFNTLEKDTCSLVRDTISYIQGEIGQPAIDDPSLLMNAVTKAVGKVDGQITSCKPGEKKNANDLLPQLDPADGEVTDDMFFSNGAALSERISRMKRTLREFVEPQAKKTYEKTMRCDGFMDFTEGFEDDDKDSSPAGLVNRLTGIQAISGTIHASYIDPIKRKQAELESGRPSDCDKEKGQDEMNKRGSGDDVNKVSSGGKVKI